jgi:uncharacterized protein
VEPQQQVLWLALAVGLAFGIAGQRSGFCLTSGLRDYLRNDDGRRLRAFTLAMAVALLGTQALTWTGVVDLGPSVYLQPTFSWLLVPLGGVLFGLGMVMANGCGARALVLLGTGNLRSLLVLLCLGISAFAALRGVLAPMRLALADVTAMTPAWQTPTLPGVFTAAGLGEHGARLAAVLLIAGPLLYFSLADRALRASPRDWLGGSAIGALVPAGWFATGNLGADPFEPVRLVSLTFVAPIGDTLQYLMLATGMRADFGILVITGVPAGALLAALLTGTFRWQAFDSPRQMLRGIGGGALMGIGGALALGCSIGQGITGVSTLAIGSFAAALGIVAGAAVGMRSRWSMPEAGTGIAGPGMR